MIFSSYLRNIIYYILERAIRILKLRHEIVPEFIQIDMNNIIVCIIYGIIRRACRFPSLKLVFGAFPPKKGLERNCMILKITNNTTHYGKKPDINTLKST